MKNARSDTAAPTVALAQTARNAAHILLVDDDHEVRVVAKALLARQGYRVTDYPAPAEALAAFAAAPGSFDALVTDYMMPGMRGDDLIMRMRAIRSDLPVLMISGVAGTIDDPVINSIKPVQVLPKPMSMKGLAAALRNVLNGSAC
jgi:DNA-binding response OmpR family regulator